MSGENRIRWTSPAVLIVGIAFVLVSVAVTMATEHLRHIETCYWHGLYLSKRWPHSWDLLSVPLCLLGILLLHLWLRAKIRQRSQNEQDESRITGGIVRR